jgi:hypothetical protein
MASGWKKWRLAHTCEMRVVFKKGHKICQHFPFQDHPKFTQNWDFGLKINHLATRFRA